VVIVGVDPGPVAADEAWRDRMMISQLKEAHDQPFYWCLVDVADRPSPMMAYVAQEHLVQSQPLASRLASVGSNPTAAQILSLAQERKMRFSHPDVAVFFNKEAPSKLTVSL